MSLQSWLYRVARTLNTVKAITSGNPRKMRNRGLNILIGRTIVPKLWRR